MTVLEKIKRCVELVWDFEEIYDWSDIEAFCGAELGTYPQHDEILDYFKHIAELEKENAELKEQNTNLQEMLKTERSVTCKEEYLKKVTELEQENAELKEKYVQNICDCDICDTYCNSQFTKAKDILKRLVSLSNNSRSLLGGTWHETVREAEQFLNSEVEK